MTWGTSVSKYTYRTRAHDCHQSVIVTSSLRLSHEEYIHMYHTGTVSQAIVQWSSPADTSHTDCTDVL